MRRVKNLDEQRGITKFNQIVLIYKTEHFNGQEKRKITKVLLHIPPSCITHAFRSVVTQ